MQVSIGLGKENPHEFAYKHAVFGGIGLMAAIVAARMPYQNWKPLLAIMYPIAAILLVMTRLVGKEINGSHRWLDFGPITVQPSEIGKLVIILWLATWFAHVQRRSHEFVRGFVVPGLGLGVMCALVLIGPDLGTTVLMGAVGAGMMFLAGTNLFYLLLLAGLGVAVFVLIILNDPERMSRVMTFMEPEKYESEGAYQLMQSLFAFVSGGGKGVGFGHSSIKHSYLPEAHTDFILAIIAEEFGVVGPLLILLVFLAIFVCGLRIGWFAHDTYGRLIAFGITLMFGLQSAINIGVVTGSLPTKGLPLPFVSYGGSSLAMSCVMIGVLVSIAHHNSPDAIRNKRRPVKDSQHWL